MEKIYQLRNMKGICAMKTKLLFFCSVAAVFIFVVLTPTSFAAYDLVKNSDFKQGLAGWTVIDSRDSAISANNGEVKFQGMLGSNSHGIRQELELDCSEYLSLILSASIKLEEAKMAGTGLNGLEAPLAVFVEYTDADGIVHKTKTQGAQGVFWRGFYYEEPVPPAVTLNGQKVERGIWQEYKFDLMTLQPKPRLIHAIGAEGSGWGRRSAVLRQLSLTSAEAGREFVINPSLNEMAAGWKPCLDFAEAEYQSEIVPLPHGMQLKSALSSKRAGLLQKIEADVSGFKSLVLTAEVLVEKQSLSGTGYNGREAPLALFVTYTDVNGIKHDSLPMTAADTLNRMFWRGLYILKPQPPATGANGMLLEAGKWSTVKFDLLQLDPKPMIIHSLGVEGAGRPPRDASVKRISLKGW